jgi:hypothetical protein
MSKERRGKILPRIIIAGLIVAGIIAFRYFDLGQYFTLEYLKGSQATFQALYLEELAKIDSLSRIISPGVLISFAVLGLFPITAKKILALYKQKFKPVPSRNDIHDA